MVQPEWAVMVSAMMAFLMLGWLGLIAVLWAVSVIGLIRAGVRFFLQPPEPPAAWWEPSETGALPPRRGSDGYP